MTGTSRANSKRARERSRVASHIARAEKLARENAPALDPLQSLVRALLLDALREYHEAGRFPHNHRRGCNTPVFVDEHETPCAVGYLLALSGQTQLVAKISSERNLATVHELSAEPALAEWLTAAGLSLREAEWIQPSYVYCSSGAQCFCTPFSSPSMQDLLHNSHAMVAQAVLDCTMTGATTARIDQIHGTTTGHAVGDTLSIQAIRGTPGPRALVAVLSDGRQPTHWGPIPDGGPTPYIAIGVGADGYATCDEFVLGRSARAQASNVISALTSASCTASLNEAEPTITPMTCTRSGGCGCVVAAPDAAPAATLSILLALVTALTVRRARALRRSPRPSPGRPAVQSAEKTPTIREKTHE